MDLLTAEKPFLGTFLEIPATEMSEIVGIAGFDCAIVDAEHETLLSGVLLRRWNWLGY